MANSEKKSKYSKEKISGLWDRVKKAEEYQNKHFKKAAIRSMKLLRGDISYLPQKFEYDTINPNLYFSTIRNYLPALYLKNPEIYIKPRTPEWGTASRDNYMSSVLIQSAVAYYQDILGMKQTDKLVILSSLIEGAGYAYSWWETKLNNGKVIIDRPMHRFVNGIDVLVDPTVTRFDDAAFVVRKFGGAPNYMQKLGYKNVKQPSDRDDAYTKTGEDETGRVELPTYYEVFDKENESIIIMSEATDGTAEYHSEKEFNVKEGFPLSPLVLNPSIDRYYPQSLGSVLESSQKIITLLSTFGIHHVKRAIPKIAARSKALTPRSKRALLNDEDQALVEIGMSGDSKDRPLDDIVKSIQQSGLSPDFYNLLNLSRDYMNILSGVHDEARGGAAGGSKTATEANILESFLRARMDDYRDIVRDYVKESREKLIKQMRKHASRDQYLRFNVQDVEAQMLGNSDEFKDRMKVKGPYTFMKWSKEDISDQYDIEIGVGATLPLNKESEYKKALQDYSMMANDPYMNPVKVRQHFLQRIGVPDIHNWVQPPEPPAQEPPDDPFKASLSINFEDLDDPTKLSPTQIAVLQKLGVIPQPAPPPGEGAGQPEAPLSPLGNEGNPGGGLNPLQPLDPGSFNESFTPGMQLPANMQEIPNEGE